MPVFFTPEIKPQESITDCLNQFADKKFTVNENNNIITAAIKLSAHTVTCITLTFIGIIETIIRHALALIIKLLTIVVPKGYASKLDQYYVRPFLCHSAQTAGATAIVASKIITNFISKENRCNIIYKIENFIENIYSSRIINCFFRLHFNGFSKKPNTTNEFKKIPVVKKEKSQDQIELESRTIKNAKEHMKRVRDKQKIKIQTLTY